MRLDKNLLKLFEHYGYMESRCVWLACGINMKIDKRLATERIGCSHLYVSLIIIYVPQSALFCSVGSTIYEAFINVTHSSDHLIDIV